MTALISTDGLLPVGGFRMRFRIGFSVVALMASGLAGCLDENIPPGETANEAPAIAVDESLRIDAKDCIQGGGNSVYKGAGKPLGPFTTADQLPEIGNPTIGAFGAVFGPGDTSDGIWHIGTICKSYTYQGKEYKDFHMGWIAQLIERPDFDVWDEPRIQFMVADLSFNNDDFVTVSKEATRGAEISPATNMVIEWYAPEKYMHVVITEASHGTFDFTAEIHKEFAQKETEHLRFWMLPRTDGIGHAHCESNECSAAEENILYRPISIDLFDTAKPGARKLAGESLGTFVHLNGEEQHQGNPLGHYWDGFDRTIVIGPAPEGLTFDRTWLH